MTFQVAGKPGWQFLGRRTRRSHHRLYVENDAIQLLSGDETIGQIPFANVELIRNLWNRDDRPHRDRVRALLELAGVLVTFWVSIVDTLWFWMYADSARERSHGIVIVLKNAGDTSTWWLASGFKEDRKQIHITGAWEMSFAEIVEWLREEEMRYLEARGLATESEQDTFEFGKPR